MEVPLLINDFLRRAVRLHKPVAYLHPAGAVIWVNLRPEVVRRIERAS